MRPSERGSANWRTRELWFLFSSGRNWPEYAGRRTKPPFKKLTKNNVSIDKSINNFITFLYYNIPGLSSVPRERAAPQLSTSVSSQSQQSASPSFLRTSWLAFFCIAMDFSPLEKTTLGTIRLWLEVKVMNSKLIFSFKTCLERMNSHQFWFDCGILPLAPHSNTMIPSMLKIIN